jgi:hypothetical protein
MGALPWLIRQDQEGSVAVFFGLDFTVVSIWSAALRRRDQVETESVLPTGGLRIGLLGCLLRLVSTISKYFRPDVREKDGCVASAQRPMLLIECEGWLLTPKAGRIWRGGRFHAYSSDG